MEYVETRDVPIRKLTRFPGNARRGNVDRIRESIRTTGQYRAIVVRDTTRPAGGTPQKVH